ncbi:MAG: TetR/AcrR family transcriptional regulator [Rhizomicrobium sp.]
MKRRSADGNPTKDRLFAAGKKLFASKPYDEVAIDDIANEAGVAHGLLFHYFKSKLDFYLYVFHVDRDDMRCRRAEVTRRGTPDQRLRRFVEFHMNHLREWPWSHVLLLRGGAPAKLVAEAEVVRMAGVREVLGYFSPDPPTEHELLLGRAWLGCQGEILLGWLQGGRTSEAGVLEICVALFYEILSREPLLRTGRGRARTRVRKPRAPRAPSNGRKRPAP